MVLQAFTPSPFPPSVQLKYVMNRVNLIHHPATPQSSVRKITAIINGGANETLEIQYALDGKIDELWIPPTRSAQRKDNLWQHTCFEAFIAAPDDSSYIEFNFSPSGEWAIYTFDTYRSGMTAIDATPPIVTMHGNTNRLQLNANIEVSSLPLLTSKSTLRLALAAVIENRHGDFSYWALAHPPGKPDFHHADSFALTLNPWKNSE